MALRKRDHEGYELFYQHLSMKDYLVIGKRSKYVYFTVMYQNYIDFTTHI